MNTKAVLNDIFNTIRKDYAGFPEKERLDDPSPLVTMTGQAYHDHKWKPLLLLRGVNQYLADMEDRNLKFTMKGEGLEPFTRGFSVRRTSAGEMFVDEVSSEARLKGGEAVLAINGEVPEWLVKNIPNNFLSSKIPEREQWNGYLKMASRITVRDIDTGAEKTLELKKYPVEKPHEPVCETCGENVIIRLYYFGSREETEAFISENRGKIENAGKLIIDLRKNSGGAEEGFLPLLPYIIEKDCALGDVFGSRDIYTNYTEMNCKRMLYNLYNYRETAACGESPEAVGEVLEDEIKRFRENSGKGWICEKEELFEEKDFELIKKGPDDIEIWIDTWTENEAEEFVLAAGKAGRAVIKGRNTMGNIDYSTPVVVRYENCAFTYPISKTKAAFEGHGVSGKGIAPDVLIPWSPNSEI
ncbi:MAG: hypothetical protein K6F39_09210 [Lachnospiraceae bacterium]|nr:hypothetical protein [Lachnospiraceae bacterium]